MGGEDVAETADERNDGNNAVREPAPHLRAARIKIPILHWLTPTARYTR
jgi:hypothetical protein